MSFRLIIYFFKNKLSRTVFPLFQTPSPHETLCIPLTSTKSLGGIYPIKSNALVSKYNIIICFMFINLRGLIFSIKTKLTLTCLNCALQLNFLTSEFSWGNKIKFFMESIIHPLNFDLRGWQIFRCPSSCCL